MLKHLAESCVVISGGTSGIGYAVAERLVRGGAKVVVTGRDVGRVELAQSQLTALGSALAIQADAGLPQDWQRVIAVAEKFAGPVDVFVANHGTGGHITELAEQSIEDIASTIHANLTSVIYGCHAVLPHMRARRRGHIVVVGSACTYHSWPQWSVYTAAKSGLAGFTRCLHVEMAAWGGKASLFCPGATQTGFQQAAGIAPDLSGFPDAGDMADMLLSMLDIPRHMVIESLSAWGTAQVLNPF